MSFSISFKMKFVGSLASLLKGTQSFHLSRSILRQAPQHGKHGGDSVARASLDAEDREHQYLRLWAMRSLFQDTHKRETMGRGKIKEQPKEASSQSSFGSCLSGCSQTSFRAGKMGKVLALKLQGPECDSLNLYKKLSKAECACNPSNGKTELAGLITQL